MNDLTNIREWGPYLSIIFGKLDFRVFKAQALTIGQVTEGNHRACNALKWFEGGGAPFQVSLAYDTVEYGIHAEIECEGDDCGVPFYGHSAQLRSIRELELDIVFLSIQGENDGLAVVFHGGADPERCLRVPSPVEEDDGQAWKQKIGMTIDIRIHL